MNLSRHFLLDSSSDDEAEHLNIRRKRKVLRDTSDPLSLDERSFIKRFRLSKEAFKYVLDNLHLPEGTRSTFIPPILKLAAVLEVLGGGGYQWTTSNDFVSPMAQSTLSSVLHEVVSAMETKLCTQWITFTENFQSTKQWVYNNYKIPGVIGFVDGTHIILLRPSENEHIYINRKYKHSLNVMLICDHSMRIIAICTQYGGASHDSFVWASSNERNCLQNKYNRGHRGFWLLGDSGYPLEPWLITPFSRMSAIEGNELRFNEIHRKARSTIERCIGIYKGRWRILMEERKARYSPQRVAVFANLCAALHNI